MLKLLTGNPRIKVMMNLSQSGRSGLVLAATADGSGEAGEAGNGCEGEGARLGDDGEGAGAFGEGRVAAAGAGGRGPDAAGRAAPGDPRVVAAECGE